MTEHVVAFFVGAGITATALSWYVGVRGAIQRRASVKRGPR